MTEQIHDPECGDYCPHYPPYEHPERVRRRLLHDASVLMLEALEASEREFSDMEDSAPVDAGCIECTCGTVPNTLNTGLCAHHKRVHAIKKAMVG